jgi:nitroimidazol reductase NimA-like FMN-containing flavoprotein (pyridoxamine 5'-phosphate oxidase superfamily)
MGQFMTNDQPPPSAERTRLRRKPERGSYDQAVINAILDEGLVCHIGFTVDDQPYVIPTTYCRVEDKIYIHGAVASRMLKTLQAGLNLCLTVTLLDALVVARSAFNNSMNYRSVVVLGQATVVQDFDEKFAAMQALVEHILPGRWEDCRPPTPNEVRATSILALPIAEASAKIRSGQVVDDAEDYELPVWAGLVPFQPQPLAPVDDGRVPAGIEAPAYLTDYRR